MKTFLLLTRALFCCTSVLLFSGCSYEQDEWHSDTPAYRLHKNGVISPYDSMGQACNNIYREYRNIYVRPAVPASLVIRRVEDIARRTVILEPYLQIEEEAVEDIISGSIPLKDYADTVLSPEAQNMLIPFLNSLNGIPDNGVYIAALDFENEIISNTGLNHSDIRILLTLTSIMKYHTENGDDDWPDQGTNITKAVLYGSMENSSKAVIMAVVVRLTRESY